ncbi:MAG: hypothetical protein BMS9Abin29_1780 [Gemmatimonadota bacterium]|nr:MAG: hypothetical protein BMS9Abin29_1780 [Gemmatimonadota bacterium]
MKSAFGLPVTLLGAGMMAVARDLGAQVATAPSRPQPPPGMMKNMLLASGVLLVTVVGLVVIAVIWHVRSRGTPTADSSGESLDQVGRDPF